MKAIVNNQSLKKELAFISPIMKSNRVIPLLESIKMEFRKNGTLTISATDLETTIVLTTGCEAKKDFSFCIPFRYIYDVCNNSVAPIEFKIDGNKVFIVSGVSKNNHPVNEKDISSFPLPPEIEPEVTLDVDGTFFHYLSNAISFKSKQLADLQYHGAFLNIYSDRIFIAGTNRFIAFIAIIKKDTGAKEHKCIIPENFCNITKGFQESNIHINESHMYANYWIRKYMEDC